jgi:DNA replication and repair protein RecF
MPPLPHPIPTLPTLWLERLTLTAFRSYSSLTLELTEKPVILTGANGAGKTNILEAISFFSPGRGLRKASLDTIQSSHTHQSWAVAAQLHTPEGLEQIGTGRDPSSDNARRVIKINGELTKNQAKLAEIATIIWLTPQMDGLFLDAASSRRKFLDRLVYHFDPTHVTRVNQYEHAMRERARLLQMQGDPHWLSTLERSMAEQAVAIAHARLDTLSMIQHTIDEASTPFPKPTLSIEGQIEAECQSTPALTLEETLCKRLCDARGKDRATGRTSIGTHRSDLLVLHRDKNCPASLASTGEQKALLLSIVLAEVRARAKWRGAVPLLLLDEVVAHLDIHRREALFNEIKHTGAQCWMTGTDMSLFEAMGDDGQWFGVEDGRVKKALA